MSHSHSDHEISRVLRSKDAAKFSYDRMSKWYDWLAGSTEWQYTRAGLDLLNAQPGESVLEIGYGTGRALLALGQDVGTHGYIAGIDISTGMQAVAQERLCAAGLLDSVDLRCGDALHLPFPPDSFDAVFISFTLELFDTPEIPLILAACRRVLHVDGRIAIVAMAKKEPEGLAVHIYNWAHQVIPNYVDCRPIYTKESVLQADFHLQTVLNKTMWGLPVDVILACKTLRINPDLLNN
jgi:demethylmenaquinone methyltransferase/2-methoxy-6-polyprenyl-1,4-benzoquinol methylase